MKVKNHFNHFWSIFAFLSIQWYVFFSCKYIQSHHNIKNNLVFFLFFFLGYVLPQYEKTLWKSFVVLRWFRFKNDHGSKNSDNTKRVTVMCFHPLVHVHGVKYNFIFLATIFGLEFLIWWSNFNFFLKTPYVKLIKAKCIVSS
jgi:hypothetical protein